MNPNEIDDQEREVADKILKAALDSLIRAFGPVNKITDVKQDEEEAVVDVDLGSGKIYRLTIPMGKRGRPKIQVFDLNRQALGEVLDLDHTKFGADFRKNAETAGLSPIDLGDPIVLEAGEDEIPNSLTKARATQIFNILEGPLVKELKRTYGPISEIWMTLQDPKNPRDSDVSVGVDFGGTTGVITINPKGEPSYKSGWSITNRA